MLMRRHAESVAAKAKGTISEKSGEAKGKAAEMKGEANKKVPASIPRSLQPFLDPPGPRLPCG